jgi:hypothetical protein
LPSFPAALTAGYRPIAATGSIDLDDSKVPEADTGKAFQASRKLPLNV